MIQGIYASNAGIVGDRVGDFASAILVTQPSGTAPLLALTAGMAKEGASDTVFTWFEDSHQGGRTATTSGGTTTTVVVSDGSYYVPNTVLLVEETGEIILVTATNGNSMTVTRGIGGTTVTSITNAMHVQEIGNAHEEGSGMPTAVTQQGHPRMNYVQIFRNSWAITGTAKVINFRTGSRAAKNKRDAATYHAEGQERAFLWGKKHIGTLNGKQFRMTDGFKAQVQQYGGKNLSAASAAPGGSSIAGQLNLWDFNDWIRQLYATNVKGQPNERIGLGGDLVLQVVQMMVSLDVTYQITQGENKFGIMVTQLVTPFGKLSFMTHPLMNENPSFQRELYAMHPGGIKRRVLRDTFEEGYDQDGNRINGIDADQGQMTTEVGLEVDAASTMGILSNVQTAVKSHA